jgi:hypothetical protein
MTPTLTQIQATRTVLMARARYARYAELDRLYRDKLSDAGLHLLRHAAFAAYLELRALGETPPAVVAR